MKAVLAVLLLLPVSFISGQSEICFGLADGTKFKHFNRSDKYYVCKNDKAIEANCDDNQSFVCLNDETMSTGLPGKTESPPTNGPPDSICAGEVDGTLLANPERCDAFYMCFFGISIPGICPESQYFNPEIDGCEDSENVNCVDPSITTTVEPNICEGMQDGDRFDNPTSCSHFFICINNAAISIECPLGLYFNVENGQCNPPEIVTSCETPITTTTEAPTTTTEKPFNDACVGLTDGTLVDNPIACDAFFFCMNENAISGRCPYPAVFNSQLETCDSVDNVICYETTTEPTIEINICYGKDDFEFLDDPRTCAGYFICFNEEATPRTCPDGRYFDPSSSICLESHLVICDDGTVTKTTTEYTTEETTTTISEIPDGCPSVGNLIMIPDPNRCSRFLLCAAGFEVPMVCEQGHHFNYQHQECLPRDNAKCSIPLPTCDPENSSSVPLTFLHPHYCEKFFICFLGQMQAFECGAGQHFDKESDQCMSREQVFCEII